MRQSPERRQEVLDAANRMIAAQGLAKFSMLALAQELGMSKETLYAWFGSKGALMEELVRGNAGQAMAVLRQALERPVESAAALERMLAQFCRLLLGLLMSERSIALNRGAIHMSEGPGFGQTLRSQGRDEVIRQLKRVMDQAVRAGVLRQEPTEPMAEVLIALALRDWQLERLLGRMGEPRPAQLSRRAAEAAGLFMRLYAGTGG